jgi:uncharacterized protein with von Willebrand factor type A (vWA) domain
VNAVLAYPARDGAPPTPTAARLVGFVRLLRDNGFRVGVREAMDAGRLARGIDVLKAHELRWGLRVLLCSCRADWGLYDELFDAYWRRQGMRRAEVVSEGLGAKAARRLRADGLSSGSSGLPEQVTSGDAGDVAGHGDRREGASTADALGAVDLRHINDPDELKLVNALAERLAARMRYRLSRRQRVRSRGRRLDLRTIIHRSIPYGGTPMRLAFRRRRDKPLRLIMLVDVSGSMSLYSTFFVRFIRGVIENFRQADAFVFHTRLVHIGPALRERDVDRAVERMGLLAAGWSGGTRIGESLRAFNRHFAANLLGSRTVVMIVSDGYDTGSPELLGEELARIKRRAHRVVWLNPMIGWRDYEPVAGGMQAALPHVDLFAPAHNLQSLMALEPYLERL